MSKECCSHEEDLPKSSHRREVTSSSQASSNISVPSEEEDHHGHHHEGTLNTESFYTQYGGTFLSFILLVVGIILDASETPFFYGMIKPLWYGVAYILVGGKILKYAWINIKKGNVFNEFFLMSIATLGAFYIKEYAEGVAVMLFYVVGEHFQEAAVVRSRKSIKALLDNRPDRVNFIKDRDIISTDPHNIQIGDLIQIRPGEKVALDGELITPHASFNTAALTGESKPNTKEKGDQILAGMINLEKAVEVRVTSVYEDSALSKILKMVERATGRKAKTQNFISKFAKIYTPIVVFLALGITLLPYFFVQEYIFNQWLYRALIFLVISCPCALVISIPLGYFGGIGAASRNGILFKGSNFLDLLAKVDVVVLDKTGTLTKGVFNVQQVESETLDKKQLIELAAALESHSTHPIAQAIIKYSSKGYKDLSVEGVEEISGFGLIGKVDGKEIIVGNTKLLKRQHILYDDNLNHITDTLVVIAVDGKYEGYIIIADEIKHDAAETLKGLNKLGIKNFVVLSGDKTEAVQRVAKDLNIQQYHGELLPEDKVNKVSELKKNNKTVAFVGDGINDAPVITIADVGIAMGALGSDAAIEAADVVIQNDQLSKIVTAVNIGRKTNRIVWQNIGLSFTVKLLVLALGAGGIATMWEAVFADVGVALLAILNAVQIQRKVFE